MKKAYWYGIIGGLIVCLVMAAVPGLLFCPNRFSPGPKILVYVPAQSSARQVAQILGASEMVLSDRLFLAYVRLSGRSRDLRAGYYEMSPEWSMHTVLETLCSPNTHARLIRTTIPEGYSLKQIAMLLSQKGVASSASLLGYWQKGVFSDYGKKYPYLMAIPTASVEGYLFPDTYLFAANSSPKEVTGMFLETFDKKIFSLWRASGAAEIGVLTNFHAYLTLASLVEKEAVLREEMPTIAGVFYNRLKKGMPLATDPTIVYAMGEVWRPQLLYRDLKIESPYNTYKYKGLPPTPIASPGESALRAVLRPEVHGYLFFVALKEGGGRHVFTRSYREHLSVQGY